MNINSYGRYKSVRDASWQALIDCNISVLPVSLSAIAAQNNIKLLKDSSVKILLPNEIGASVFESAHWSIIYDDSVSSVGRRRFTVAHELGHIFLGHPLTSSTRFHNGVHFRTFSHESQPEYDADSFASRLLAPACVLWSLDLHTPKEISNICNISLEAASIRAKRMETLYSRQKFLISPLERQVYNNFLDYINEYKPQ